MTTTKLYAAFVWLTIISSLFIFASFGYLEYENDRTNIRTRRVERHDVITEPTTTTTERSFISRSGYRLLSVLRNEQGYQSALKLIAFYDVDVGNFENFNNETGVDHFIVPNIIHFVQFNRSSFKFFEYICLRSAYLQQRPDYIFIHTDMTSGFKGKYWNWIENELDFISVLKFMLCYDLQIN